MRNQLLCGLAALLAAGCGPASTPRRPVAPAVDAPPTHELVGQFQARVTPSPDRRAADFEITPIEATLGHDANPPDTVELYSSVSLADDTSARSLAEGPVEGCTGAITLSAPVWVKSYFNDQLRDVVVEITDVTGTNHTPCGSALGGRSRWTRTASSSSGPRRGRATTSTARSTR